MPQRTLSESEWTTIRDQVLASAPKGMDETTYTRWIGPKMAAAIGEAENSPAPFDSSASMRAVKGLASTLNPMPLIEALVSPDARNRMASSIGQSMGDQFQKARTAPTLSERIGHGAAAALPILGPAAADAGETIASGDYAGGAGKTVGLIAPVPAMEAVSKLRGMTTGAGGAALADRLQTSATNRLSTEMGPKVGPNKVRLTNQLAKVSPDVLREPGLNAFTKEGFATKVAGKLDDAVAAMDDAADARLASQQVRTGPILSQLDAEIAKLSASPVDASAYPRQAPDASAAARARAFSVASKESGQPTAADGDIRARIMGEDAAPMGHAVEPAPNAAQIATLRQIRKEVQQLGPVAPYDAIRTIRQSWDQVAKAKYMPATAQDALKSSGEATAAMKGTGALREGLAGADPQSAAAYRQYSIFKSANDVLTAAQEAERARPQVGRGLMRTGSGAVAGAVSGGGVGAVVGATVGWIADRAAAYAPTMQVFIARQMQGIADALRAGNAAQAQNLAVNLKASLPTVQLPPDFAATDTPVAPSNPGARGGEPGGGLDALLRRLGGRQQP